MEKLDDKTIGAAIRAELERRDMSIAELARRINMSRSNVSDLLHGHATLTDAMLVRLLAALKKGFAAPDHRRHLLLAAGIKLPRKSKWTPEIDAMIGRNPDREIAAIVGASIDEVYRRRAKLGRGSTCLVCGRAIGENLRTAYTQDGQTVYVGRECRKLIQDAGANGYQPPVGGRLYSEPPE